ncbi:acyl CoA binding protein-domain-containing protein [Naematelia encephala]|uniref:Acyl CoA binding protein-domain-containing protein n=1 Tax=Naematelia encephala TaxID=71784 RepID=A0A1Y2AP71_9TREE|nr:acyl CoA binding protein-domain-containing protein [Naematelia encephala]
MASQVIDAQFHRAVDIVQSLPKAGPVQTSYEDKLRLYALYKQATEGDISITRPGLLDMLGRAKWDSWNKQKGVKKVEAKRLYVASLLKILRRFADRESAKKAIEELEGFSEAEPSEIRHRPASPASSSSSYHSSQASPPLSPPSPPRYVLYPPPDPSLPPPDVAPDIIPPSALTHSHRSLLSLTAMAPPDITPSEPQSFAGTPALGPAQGSRTHSLIGGRGGGEAKTARKDSVHSFRQSRMPQGHSALGFVPEQQPKASSSRPYSPQLPQARDYATPEISGSSPYLGISQGMPLYPRPGSASTFSQQPLNVPHTLQQIQTSLAALHERLSSLERSQAMLLRRDDRRKRWFWSSADELDEMEEDVERERWPTTRTTTRIRQRKSLSVRAIWWLIAAVRRATIDAGVGLLILLAGIFIMSGGWRRTRATLARVRVTVRQFISES